MGSVLPKKQRSPQKAAAEETAGPAMPAEWLQRIATIAPVGIYRADVSGRYVWVNAQWIEMTGHTLADAQGFGWKELIHPDDRARVVGEWTEALNGTKPFQVEYRHLRLDGSVLWIHGRAVEAHDGAGKVAGYVGASTDITAFHPVPDGPGNGSGGNNSNTILTLREQEVVRHIAGGDSNKCVADRLGLSVRTVESHRARIMRKLNITSLPGLVRYAVRSGFVSV
jgi:PAS domain S-box-containing protein